MYINSLVSKCLSLEKILSSDSFQILPTASLTLFSGRDS